VPLSPGVRLGAYEVIRLIGAGGMGEVYEALDTRLNRIVAVKVLPEAFAADPERRERFEREARSAAALNHPHICGLHDVGEGARSDSSASSTDTIRFLVMEHLEGHTLADRLARGPLPLAEALRHAIEIADALDHAHHRGLVHRDLKPGNVMLTGTGAKLLDFGLSKPHHAPGVPSLATASPEDAELTTPGTLLGTFPYMAPEVLEGHEADGRTDLFALGAIIYEMVSGKRAFQARTTAGLIGAILHSDPPPLSTLQKLTPPALDHLVARCLVKNPAGRWQTARDVLLELQWIERGGRADARSPDRFGVVRSAGISALTAGLAAFTLASYVRAPSPVGVSARLTFSFPQGLRPADVAIGGPVTISPDGRRVVFPATGPDGTQLLWVRALDSSTALALTGTDDGAHPFWSPDSRSIAFFAQRKLKKVQIDDGPPRTLCDAVLPRGGTWSRDGVIIYAAGAGREMYRVSSQGGDVAALPPDGFNEERYWPSFLPDGRHFLYFGRPHKFGIYVGSTDSAGARLLLSDYVSATYSPAGYLLGILGSARGAPTGTLLAHRFDPDRLELSGEALPVAEGIQYNSGLARAAFSLSENGTLVYESVENPKTELTWFDRRGNRLETVGRTAGYGQPSLSPDERTIVVERVDPITQDEDLWVIDRSRDVASRLTADPNIDFMPTVAPDGSSVMFASARSAPPNLFQKVLKGPNAAEERLVPSSYNSQPTDWSPDGRFVIFARLDTRTQWDLWQLPMSATGKERVPVPLVVTEFNEHLGRLSPDGRRMAYVSDASGRNEVYVRELSGSETVRRISTEGGSEPRWRGDGRELFYVAADRRLMAVGIRSDAGFEVSTPVALFVIPIGPTRNSGYDVNYTVTRDGLRFLVSAVTGESEAPRTKIVMNWPVALRGR
jgi:Tol biopolymer transport system component